MARWYRTLGPASGTVERPRLIPVTDRHGCRYAGVDARKPARLAAPAAPDPGRDDRRGSRRGAGGLGPDGPSGRRGARRGRRADLRGARTARRDPPRRGLSDAADRDDRGRSRGDVPVGRAGTRGGARARDGRRRGEAEGARRAATRAAESRIAPVPAVPPRRAGLVHAVRGDPMAGGPRGRGLGGPARPDDVRPRRQDRRARRSSRSGSSSRAASGTSSHAPTARYGRIGSRA